MRIEHLRLSKHRGIESITLLNLGHINVVCGKNNSGKSSVLEAIVKQTKSESGFTVTDEGLAPLIVGITGCIDLNFDYPRDIKQMFSDFLRAHVHVGEAVRRS